MFRRRTKSPLKDKPLRNPGQSLDDQLSDLFTDDFLAPLLVAILVVTLAVLEWIRYFKELPPIPQLFSVIAVVAIAYAAFRIVRAIPRARALKLARNGERVVGQYLDRLRGRGYRVFHDVVGSGFNLDHVLVGPTGIYTIETKTYSKPVGRDAKVAFDGETLLVNGMTPERNPVVQAKAQARWLRELLAESTDKKFLVRPVIVFPGWFVEQAKATPKDVWVLNPKALPDFLEQEPDRLSSDDVSLASIHLSRFIRTTPG